MPLSTRPISLPARRIIREAFEELERTVSPVESKEFENTTLQNVRDAALQIENLLAARQSLRNMRRLAPLFAGLQHYSKSIEVLCNGTPYLPWVWAPIKLILTVASDYVEAFERIIHAYSCIAESLCRFELLDKALNQSWEFQETLAIFYSDILKFHREAYVFVRRSGWKLFFLTSWGRFQRRFNVILDDLKAHETLIDKTANAVNISEATKMRQSLRDWRAESMTHLAKQEHEDSARQYRDIVVWLKMDDADQQVIYDSIALEASKYPGTCDWILKNSNLASWMKDKPENPFIWLRGNPGTGKSVIATQIDTFLRSSGQSLVVRHFCTYSHESSTEYDQILRSILLQVARSSADLIAHIYENYVQSKRAATIPALSELILTSGGAISPVPSRQNYVHIIFDGLDECEAEKQGRVITLLERLMSSTRLLSTTVYKVLVSSRPLPLLERRFRKKPTLSLLDEKKNIELSIGTYASQKLGLLRHRLSQLGMVDGDIKEISIRIAQKADGMFLWARLVLEYLSSNIFYSSDEVKVSVDTLPQKLCEFYERILAQIASRLDARSMARLRSILAWIAFARRPLRKIECRSALAFGEGNPETTALPPPFIFDVCAPLIYENVDTTFSFIHVSVKNHLMTAGSSVLLKESDAIFDHGLASLNCLLAGIRLFDAACGSHDRMMRLLSGLHGFHIYATEYWAEYLLQSRPDGSRAEAFSSLINAAELLYKNLNMVDNSTESGGEADSSVLDHRIENFAEHRIVYCLLRTALLERSAKTPDMQAAPKVIDFNALLSPPRSISDLLSCYQGVLRSLLNISSFPGMNPAELDQFRRVFRTSAFTCRVRLCPRATMGFADENALLEHEAAHTQRIKCEVQDCQYPPFPSSRALKAHISRCHSDIQPVGKVMRIRTRENAARVGFAVMEEKNKSQPSSGIDWKPGVAPDLQPHVSKASDLDQPVDYPTRQQLQRLKQQIHAFKLLGKNRTVPAALLAQLFAHGQ